MGEENNINYHRTASGAPTWFPPMQYVAEKLRPTPPKLVILLAVSILSFGLIVLIGMFRFPMAGLLRFVISVFGSMAICLALASAFHLSRRVNGFYWRYVERFKVGTRLIIAAVVLIVSILLLNFVPVPPEARAIVFAVFLVGGIWFAQPATWMDEEDTKHFSDSLSERMSEGLFAEYKKRKTEEDSDEYYSDIEEEFWEEDGE